MSAKHLHIISFNIPYPADYGGVIDIFYKIKALKNAGIQIILHCYEYGRQPSKELEDLCLKVHYYHRKSGLKYFLLSDPYIVATRNAKSMPKHLLNDSFPVLFEGLHSTSMLRLCKAANKLTMVRAHNREHLYYKALSKVEPNLFRKLFLRSESSKLKSYESVLKQADYILGIARHETAYFKEKYGKTLFIPAFHRFEEISSKPGSGNYILYHGNLGVPENSEIVMQLAPELASKASLLVKVAGKNPSKRFLKRMAPYPNIQVIPDPSDSELDELIENAHINLLYTGQSTGIKLKLLHALHVGRHCLVNPHMVEGTGLDNLCTVVNTESDLLPALEKLLETPFSQEQLKERKTTLKDFSSRAGAEQIVRIIS